MGEGRAAAPSESGMSRAQPSHQSSWRRGRVIAAAVLAAAGWAIVVPYLGPAWELTAMVPARVEVVDHVVPGALAALAAALCLARGGRDPEAGPDAVAVAAGALAVLTGFWTTATHVPVLPVAADGELSWAAALLHVSAGPPLLAASLALLVRETRQAAE